jgi:hypothetical protein
MKLRYKLIRWLLTEDEKYLLIKAVDYNINVQELIAVTEKTTDRYKSIADRTLLYNLRRIFSTKLCY